MKIKAIKPIPTSNSCMGFDTDIREALNRGEIVEVKKIPNKGKDYVEKHKEKKDGN